MGYKVLPAMDPKWKPRKGLEGPFTFPNGRVIYYDPKEGKYYDPQTDFYLDQDEVTALQNQIFAVLSR